MAKTHKNEMLHYAKWFLKDGTVEGLKDAMVCCLALAEEEEIKHIYEIIGALLYIIYDIDKFHNHPPAVNWYNNECNIPITYEDISEYMFDHRMVDVKHNGSMIGMIIREFDLLME